MEDKADDRVWLAHPTVDGEWLSAKVTERHADGTVTVRTEDGALAVTQKAEELLLSNVLPEDGVTDMQKLNYLHEPALLHNLSHRFARDHVYTYTGKICISINPFNWDVSTPLYTTARLESYRAREMADNAPHVYAISEVAYTAILRRHRGEGGENQSILVSGESGAGKTEAVKIMMAYLAHVSAAGGRGAGGNAVAERVMQSNPLLEAFGNARTLRNDNSSRFGKFIEIQFDRTAAKMCGAQIHTYLLEKTRVIAQHAGERNYHAFYQLLAGADEATRARLALQDADAYAFLNRSGRVSIDGVDDGAELGKTSKAMTIIGMSDEEVAGAWTVVSAALALSNLSFEPDPAADAASRIAEPAKRWLAAAAAAVGCESADDLEAALCTRQICARDEWYTVRLTVEQAGDSRDALAKGLYGRLFDWLVARLNVCLAASDAVGGKGAGGNGTTSELFVGILDIFGFESFAVNSFEQLCINYANERLQQQFNWDIFKSEQVEYESEGIEWRYIDFTDNQDCLAMIDAKPLGVLHVLNEESSLQTGTDAKFLEKVKSAHGGCRYFHVPKRLLDGFVVRHYAGEVEYTVRSFREKNKDSLHPDLVGLMRASDAPLVQALFAPAADAPADASAAGASPSAHGKGGKGGSGGGKGGAKRGKGADASSHTVSTQFIQQLSALMATINSTDVQYVRCIKPNALSKAALFDKPRVALQLRCAGVLEAIRIARLAYPNRMSHLAFVERYSLLAPALEGALGGARKAAAAGEGAAVRAHCAALLAAVVSEEGRSQLGRSKVFFRAMLLERLEGLRGRTLGVRALVVQAHVRRWLAVRRYRALRAAAITVAAAQRRHAARARFVAMRSAAVRIQAAARAAVARRHVRRLRAAIRVQAAGRGLAARRKAAALRRAAAAHRLGAYARGRAARRRFCALRGAAVRLQAKARMRAQRRLYRLAAQERREEAAMSTRLAKLERQLELERQAREAAEQQRLEMAASADARLADAVHEAEARAAAATTAAAASAGGGGGGGAAAAAAGAAAKPSAVDLNDPAVLAALAAEGAAILPAGRLVNAAGRLLGGVFGGGGGGGGAHAAAGGGGGGHASDFSLEDMQSMVHQLIAERSSLRKQLETEKGRRRRADEQHKEAARKLELLEHTERVDKRRLRELADGLRVACEERDELRRMLSHGATHITELERLRDSLDKRLSQYDDDFFKLEARNMRDRAKMEELAKAKGKADEERSMYKTMLQASHERGLKEKQELRREAVARIDGLAAELGGCKAELVLSKQQLFESEQALKARLRLEEEMGVYKTMLLEERMARVELEQRIEAGAADLPPPPPAAAAAHNLATGGAGAGGAGGGGRLNPAGALIGGIRRLNPKDSWGAPRSPVGVATATRSHPLEDAAHAAAAHRPSGASAFLKGMAGGIGALANDLADAALGAEPALALRASVGAGAGRGAAAALGQPPPPPRAAAPAAPFAPAASPAAPTWMPAPAVPATPPDAPQAAPLAEPLVPATSAPAAELGGAAGAYAYQGSNSLI